MVATRRSARRSGKGQLPADGEPPETSPGDRPQSSAPRRRSRDASPPPRPGRVREKGDLHTEVSTSDDNTLKQLVEAEKQRRQGKEDVKVEEPNEVDEDAGSLEEPPGWLPDGWITEVRCDSNGSIYRYYTSPASGYTFSSKMETLHYLFSGMEERLLEVQECAEGDKLHRSHTWLPGGWVLEIRAGGKKMDKMYKFYVHLRTGKRFLSKAEVLTYVNEGKASKCDTNVLCDTSTDDNVLAHVEFNPDGLPDGWVKETIFRKCNGGIRKDPYYTDPVSHHVFRTLKSVLSYLGTGEISKHAYVPRRNVTEMYSFDKCADLPESMLKRLKVEGQSKQKSMRTLVLDKELPDDQTSNHFEEDKFVTVEATGRKKIVSETTKPRRGQPNKILKETKEIISDCDKDSHKGTKHIEVKEELDIGDGEGMLIEQTLEHTEMEKCAMVIQEVDNNNAVEKHLLMSEGDKLDSEILHEQEKCKLTEAGEKVTCSSVHKVYKRRSCNQNPSSKNDRDA